VTADAPFARSNEIDAVAARHPGLSMLVLFGSRARGDAHASSDWDLGFIGAVEQDRLLLDLVTVLGTDRIDLVDLERAGGVLRYRAARDGRVVFERSRAAFERFWLEAVHFWCDAYPVLQRGYDDVLAELER
jgi:predicted nucleotidyltransferase